MSPKGDRWQGIRRVRGLLAAVGRKAQGQGADEKKARDCFPAAANHAGTRGPKDAAAIASEDFRGSGEGELNHNGGGRVAL